MCSQSSKSARAHKYFLPLDICATPRYIHRMAQTKPTPDTTTIRLYTALDQALRRIADRKNPPITRHKLILHALKQYAVMCGERVEEER